MASPRTAPVRTGCTSTFTLKQRQLHIVVVDSRDVPYADHEYVLTVGRAEYTGRTGPDGALRHDVSSLPTGELLLLLPEKSPPPSGEDEQRRASATPVPTPATSTAAPSYPPPIVPEDFADPSSTTSSTGPLAVRWTLRLQPLPSFDSDATKAAQERLHNLGFYDVGPERGAPGPRTRSAVRAWQRRHGEPDTGRLADIQRELTRRHDTL